jgi:hypothetical protein
MVGGYVALYLYTANSAAYRAAVEFLKSREEIAIHLGAPRAFKLAYLGWSVKFSGPSGEARFEIHVKGETDSGTAVVELVRHVGQWKVRESNLLLRDGHVVQLERVGG